MFFKINRIFFKNKINLFLPLKNKNEIYGGQFFYVLIEKEKITIELKKENISQLKVILENKEKQKVKSFSVKDCGSFFINSKSFFNIYKSFDSNEVKEITFSNNEEEKQLLVTGGSARITSAVHQEEDNFPLDFSIESEINFSIQFEKFKSLIQKTIFAVDHRGDRQVLTGVAFEFLKEFSFLTATDSYRLSRVKADFSSSKNKTVVIKKEILDSIIRIFEYSKEIYFSINNQFLICKNETEERIFKGSLIEEEYPNVKNVFPKEEDFLTSISINRIEFINKVKNAKSILSKNENEIKLEFKKNDLVLFTKNPDSSFKDKIDYLNFKGQEQKINLNIQYLEEALTAFSCSEIQIHIINEEKPIIFDSTKEKNTYQLVLPLRSN